MDGHQPRVCLYLYLALCLIVYLLACLAVFLAVYLPVFPKKFGSVTHVGPVSQACLW